MQTELTQDRPFLLCELATILAMMASAPLAAAAPGTQDAPPSENIQQQSLTYEHVHGANRLSLGGFPSTRIHWLDDDRYLLRETTGWKVISADSGDKSDWYDSDALATALQTIEGVSAADAKLMADGGWIEVLHAERIVVFRQGEQLIRTTLEGTGTAIVNGVPAELELSTLSPTGSGMAFVRHNELWVADFSTGTVRQLTYDAGAHVRNAKADWVYFEEIYNRKWQAYRWSPDGQKLAYQQFDDSEVPTFQISDHTSVAQSFEQEHYPKAGEKNPMVRLGVVAIGGGATQWIDTSAFLPDDFILTHFNWMSDSATLYWYAQNRIQTWLDVQTASVHDGKSQRLMRDQTEAWVENPGDLTFLSDGSFLIFSERSGWRHLYRVSADGKEIFPVTSGAWEVRSLQAVSADESFLLVAGTKDSHIAENIYRVTLPPLSDSEVANNLVPAAEVVRLTKEEGTHAATASPHGRYFMDTWSHLNQPPTMVLRDFSGADLRVLEEPIDIPRNKYTFGKVELNEVPMADGSTTSAIFVYPPDFNPDQKYPVWLRTYAGPHAPAVKNAWSARLPEQLLANLGIVVITFDPRSASGYGAISAWLAYRKLAVEETKDLLSVCEWLEKQSWADHRRIGLSGHSYGGYFTAYAMTHCDKICAGVAGAPVTDWANYDTMYTERFMSTPQDNPDGYRQSSVIPAAANLKGRLLLIHGLKDDNVHPENTMQLAHALQQANKPFELMLYPTARHPISGDHYNRLVFNFMVQAMGKPEAMQP